MGRRVAGGDGVRALVAAESGPSVRELLAGADDADVVAFWCALMPRYAELQQSVFVSDLLAVSVPDLTPGHLVTCFDQLLADRRWFTSEIAPGYSSGVHRRVESARAPLAAIAAELADGIPATVQHDDLHDGNVFAADGRAMVLDWGVAVVSHPFCTVRVTLDVLAARLGVDPTAPGLQAVTEAHLEVWATGGPPVRRCAVSWTWPSGCRSQRRRSWGRALGSPEQGLELGFSDAVAGWLSRLADDLLDGAPWARAGSRPLG